MCTRMYVSAIIPHVILMHLEAKAIVYAALAPFGVHHLEDPPGLAKSGPSQTLNPCRRAATNNVVLSKSGRGVRRATTTKSKNNKSGPVSISTFFKIYVHFIDHEDANHHEKTTNIKGRELCTQLQER